MIGPSKHSFIEVRAVCHLYIEILLLGQIVKSTQKLIGTQS